MASDPEPRPSFSPQARISSHAEQDRLLRRRAAKEAATLRLHHGDGAIRLAEQELREAGQNAEERRYARLVIFELERLARAARPPADAPDASAGGWLARLIGGLRGH